MASLMNSAGIKKNAGWDLVLFTIATNQPTLIVCVAITLELAQNK